MVNKTYLLELLSFSIRQIQRVKKQKGVSVMEEETPLVITTLAIIVSSIKVVFELVTFLEY